MVRYITKGKPMYKLNYGILAVAVCLVGCATTSSIKDSTDVYSKPLMVNAPRVAIMDLTDSRQNPTHIGQVAALAVNQPKTPMNQILSNRIASKLVEQGLNVEKVNVTNTDDKAEISELIVSSGAKILITGKLSDFFIKSFDAMMEPARGSCVFSIKVFDGGGQIVFERSYFANAEHFIGLTGQFGADKAIDKTIDAAISQVFGDPQFQAILKNLG